MAGVTAYPSIIAHRGSSALCHENTMAAFERALADGADGIELDLRLTADGRWVIHHDAAVRSGGRLLRIAGLSMQRLAGITVGPSADPIPALDEFLAWAGTRDIDVILDIKDTGGTAELVDSIDAAGLGSRVVCSAFRRSVLKDIRHVRPRWKTALIVGVPHWRIARKIMTGSILKWAQLNEAYALHLHERWITPEVIDAIGRRRWKLGAWTVDEPARMVSLARLGVDIIITNRPAAARRTIDGLLLEHSAGNRATARNEDLDKPRTNDCVE